MIKFTQKNDINLLMAWPVDMSASTNTTETPEGAKRNLGGLSVLTYLKTRLYWTAPESNASSIIRLKAGGDVIAEENLISAGSVLVDLGGVSGAADLVI